MEMCVHTTNRKSHSFRYLLFPSFHTIMIHILPGSLNFCAICDYVKLMWSFWWVQKTAIECWTHSQLSLTKTKAAKDIAPNKYQRKQRKHHHHSNKTKQNKIENRESIRSETERSNASVKRPLLSRPPTTRDTVHREKKGILFRFSMFLMWAHFASLAESVGLRTVLSVCFWSEFVLSLTSNPIMRYWHLSNHWNIFN